MTSERRADYRAFVRSHHPDRGGDHATFIDGLARFGVGSGRPRRGAPADDDPRLDCPVVIVRRRRWFSALLHALLNVRRRPAPPRVR